MFKVTPSKWGSLEQREVLWLGKLNSNFSRQSIQQKSVTCTDRSNKCFSISLDLFIGREKLIFDQQEFVSKHQIFSFESCCLGKWRRSRIMGTFRKLGGWGAKTFIQWPQSKTQTPCETVIDTVSFRGKDMIVQYYPAFNVTPLTWWQ